MPTPVCWQVLLLLFARKTLLACVCAFLARNTTACDRGARRTAQALPLLGHMHPPFFKIMDEIQEGLRYVFQNAQQVHVPDQWHRPRRRAPHTQSCSSSVSRLHVQLLYVVVTFVSCDEGCAPRSGMEACITNLLEPGETVVIGDKGIWGARAADMAGRFGSALPRSPGLTAVLCQMLLYLPLQICPGVGAPAYGCAVTFQKLRTRFKHCQAAV